MRMVITLRNGIQIKADVQQFSTGSSAIGGALQNLKWKTTEEPETIINWVELCEIVAVHGEDCMDGG